MSTDFWAGYLSGAAGIIVGNPLDLIKVRLQARSPASGNENALRKWTIGTAAPIFGYGALNALLFVSYNRTEKALKASLPSRLDPLSTWLAGAVGGLATWIVSAPTELVKCRAQVSQDSVSSRAIARQVLAGEGVRGLYRGGTVTALRDSIGYGFYFWAYDLAVRSWPSSPEGKDPSITYQASKVLLCGGLAGVATWASVFPLDVIKTQVQIQGWRGPPETIPISPHASSAQSRQRGTWQVTRDIYRHHGIRGFFSGFTVCCARAFLVNAVQWAVYEWVMREWQQ